MEDKEIYKGVIFLKVRYIAEDEPIDIIKCKDYNVIEIEFDCYRIIDESGEDYLYHKDCFEVVKE